MFEQRFVLVPSVAGLKPSHPASVAAETELLDELRQVTGIGVEELQDQAPGSKGSLSNFVLSLGGPAVVAGAVAVIRAWIQRDARHRSLTIKTTADGQVEISGENISDQTIRDALNQISGGNISAGSVAGEL